MTDHTQQRINEAMADFNRAWKEQADAEKAEGDRPITSYEGEYELDKAKRLMAEARQHVTQRHGETDDQYDDRLTKWLVHRAEAPVPSKPAVHPDNPVFNAAFAPGQVTTNEADFHRFLPPMPDENAHTYGQRLARAGLALVLTSEDTRDIERYKSTMAAARTAKLPVFVSTNSIDQADGSSNEPYSDEAKAQLLVKAREASDRAAVTNTPRG